MAIFQVLMFCCIFKCVFPLASRQPLVSVYSILFLELTADIMFLLAVCHCKFGLTYIYKPQIDHRWLRCISYTVTGVSQLGTFVACHSPLSPPTFPVNKGYKCPIITVIIITAKTISKSAKHSKMGCQEQRPL